MARVRTKLRSGVNRRDLWIYTQCLLVRIALTAIVMCTSGTSANWMYLGMVGVAPAPPSSTNPQVVSPGPGEKVTTSLSGTRTPLCTNVPGLVTQQLQLCEANPRAMEAVSEGARRGIYECQYQFRHERWNCSTIKSENVFGHTLERGSRETAFIYAITSAGVVHAVTQSCSTGNLTDCSCDVSKHGQNTPEGWKWGGCSDNIDYGIRFSRDFVDAPERIKHQKSQNVRNFMNLHNNEAGRQAVAQMMRMQCRCHGVSGSCELKTCWMSMPTFNEVGDFLKQKYESAIQVTPKLRKKLRRRDKVKRKVPVSKDDLVHIHKSPNYCVQDPDKGILGTTGRLCNRTAIGPESCDLLCCGRGYNTQQVHHRERCQCKFVWCCKVKCKICETLIDLYTCK